LNIFCVRSSLNKTTLSETVQFHMECQRWETQLRGTYLKFTPKFPVHFSSSLRNSHK
jgi:hypothetical protein